MSVFHRLRAWVHRATRALAHRLFGRGVTARAPELRAAIRVPVDLHVRLRFEDRDDALRSTTLDISEGGIFLVTDRPRPEGTIVRLTIEIGDDLLDARGVVVRSVRQSQPGRPATSRAGMGVVFTELAPEGREMIASIVADRGRN